MSFLVIYAMPRSEQGRIRDNLAALERNHKNERARKEAISALFYDTDLIPKGERLEEVKDRQIGGKVRVYSSGPYMRWVDICDMAKAMKRKPQNVQRCLARHTSLVLSSREGPWFKRLVEYDAALMYLSEQMKLCAYCWKGDHEWSECTRHEEYLNRMDQTLSKIKFIASEEETEGGARVECQE